MQVGLQDAEQELRRRDLAIDEARWALNDAVGLPVDAPTVVADVPERPTLPIVAEALRNAYRDNPVLRALVEEQQRLEASATSISRSRLPRFAGGGMVDASTTEVVDPKTLGTGFVGFAWDIDTNTRTHARLAEARAQVEQNRIRVERELRELEHAVRSTWGAAAERLAALTTAEVGRRAGGGEPPHPAPAVRRRTRHERRRARCPAPALVPARRARDRALSGTDAARRAAGS